MLIAMPVVTDIFYNSNESKLLNNPKYFVVPTLVSMQQNGAVIRFSNGLKSLRIQSTTFSYALRFERPCNIILTSLSGVLCLIVGRGGASCMSEELEGAKVVVRRGGLATIASELAWGRE
eukprot:SAG31_NODE_92_length_26360_cov_29.601881_7_plen_120_part_00